MLETVRFIYEHGYEFTGGIVGILAWAGIVYVLVTWFRCAPEPPSITVPDDITIRLEHHFFVLGEDNLPEE